MSITLSIPWLLFWAAAVLSVAGMSINYFFPSRDEFMGWPTAGPNLPGCLLFLLGVALWLVVLGLWLAGSFVAKGGA